MRVGQARRRKADSKSFARIFPAPKLQIARGGKGAWSWSYESTELAPGILIENVEEVTMRLVSFLLLYLVHRSKRKQKDSAAQGVNVTGVGEGRGKGEKMVAGLPNASTGTGSGALIGNVERGILPVAPLIPLKSVHCVGRTVMNPKPELHLGFEPRGYGVAVDTP